MRARPRDGRGTALLLALSCASVAAGLFLPLSLVYLTVLTDIPLARIGLLLTVAGLLALPVPVLAGRLVDRVGAHPVVVVALVLQAAGYVGLVVARAPLAVLAVSAVMAVGSRLFWSSVFALVAEHADARPAQPVESWFARLNVTRTVGVVVGGLAAGAVLATDSAAAYLALAWAAAAGYGPRRCSWSRHARDGPAPGPPHRLPAAIETSCGTARSRPWPASTSCSRCRPCSQG